MKIRNGFVSNSSSSSFLIAYKQEAACYYCGRTDFDIMAHLRFISGNKCDCDSTHIAAEGHDEIMKEIAWMTEDYAEEDHNDSDYLDEAEEQKRISAKIKEHEELGYTVASIRISNHDPSSKKLVRAMAKILYDWS